MGIYDAVVERLKELCAQRHLTQNGLAYAAGVPQSTVKSIMCGESKNPGIVTLKKLCDGLDISITDFFDTPAFRELEQELQ